MQGVRCAVSDDEDVGEALRCEMRSEEVRCQKSVARSAMSEDSLGKRRQEEVRASTSK